LYLALTMGTATCFYFYLRKLLPVSLSILVSLSFVCFIPFGLPNLSYNTLGMNFFAIGAALLGLHIDGQSSKMPLAIASGFMFFAAIVCHLAFGAPIVALALICWGRGGFKLIAPVAATLFILLMIFFALLLATVGQNELYYNLQFTLAAGEHSLLDKSLLVWHQFLQVCLSKWYVCLSLLPAIFLRRAGGTPPTWAVATLAIAFPALLIYSGFQSTPILFTQAHDIVFAYALAGLLIFRFRDQSYLNSLFWAGIIGGLASSMATSVNGLVNFCVGGFLCVPTVIIAITKSLLDLRLAPSYKEDHVSSRPANLATVASYLFLVIAQLTLLIPALLNVYGELGRNYCVSKVHRGIFRGLYTSPERAHFIEALQKVMARHDQTEHTIRVIGDSGGYLLSALRPSAPTLSSYENKYFVLLEPFLRRFYEDAQNRPDLVLLIPKATGEQPSAVETAVVNDYDYRVIERGSDFTLYKRVGK